MFYFIFHSFHSPTPFAIHLIINESSQLTILDILDNSLQLVHGHVNFNIIYVSGRFELNDKLPKEQLQVSGIKVRLFFRMFLYSFDRKEITKIPHISFGFIYIYIYLQVKYLVTHKELLESINKQNIPKICGSDIGTYVHDQLKWKEFFVSLELLQNQCITASKKLVGVMSDIRSSDSQGVPPSRRQLHGQHRALSRALMDPELQNLRRKGSMSISRLQDKSKLITKNLTLSHSTSSATMTTANVGNHFVGIRLNEVMTIFNEVDRAARRLEQLTEQRRERLRELTRQRALEDEMNEVSRCFYLLNKVINFQLRRLTLPSSMCHRFRTRNELTNR